MPTSKDQRPVVSVHVDLCRRGWRIVDFTDPSSPEHIKFTPWPQGNTSTIQMELQGKAMVTALQCEQADGWGGNRGVPEKTIIVGTLN